VPLEALDFPLERWAARGVAARMAAIGRRRDAAPKTSARSWRYSIRQVTWLFVPPQLPHEKLQLRDVTEYPAGHEEPQELNMAPALMSQLTWLFVPPQLPHEKLQL
jgi:hypothetical protein